MHYIRYTLFATLTTLSVSAQAVSQDSINNLNRQKEVIELSEKLNEHKSELAKLKNELGEKEREAADASAKSQQSASANTIAATELSGNPQDKKLANNANKKARTAQRDAKSARKAADDHIDMQKDIASLESKISEEERKLNEMQGKSYAAAAGQPNQAQQQTAQQQPAQYQQQPAQYQQQPAQYQQQPAQYQQQPMQYQQQQPPVSNYQAQSQQGNYQVQPNNYTVNRSDSADMIANRVVEQTYKAFGQQAGQPAIIINNIVVPPNYNQGAQSQNAMNQSYGMSPQDRQDFEDYKAWLRERRGQQAQAYQPTNATYPAPGQAPMDPNSAEHRLTFKERFGERKARRSGIWAIPLAGIHASSFDANLRDGTAQGRSGFNAGLDLRIHMKRFFIQPGAHYFSTTTEVSSDSTVADAPLLHGPRIHSLKVPLMIGVYLTREQGAFFKFNVKGGVVGNYILAVDKDVDRQFRKENLEQYSYGVNGGFGIEFGFITIDLSHEWGISKLFKDSNNKNNILRATLGFKI